MNRFYLLCLPALLAALTPVQSQNKQGTPLQIKKSTSPITLDGKLDEQAWLDADVATNFYLNYPVDTAAAPFQTEARVTFDDGTFYVSFVCYDDQTPDVVQSLRRDFDFDTNDNMGVFIGPYNDGLNGFYFIVTPRGVQMEGTIASGGAEDGSNNNTWDNKWYSKTTRYADKWIAELAIPFKSFRYKSDEREWNITFLRYDLKRNMTSSWIATPIQFIPASFAYGGKLVWQDLPPHHSTNISIIPYVAGGASEDREANPINRDNDLQVGFDAKVGVTPSLNLDLTVNPDFSQVEVDRQVINLTRFEFRFPERRQFFLENSDLFELMGFPEARPFFSRRVGLERDSTGTLRIVPILYGARLSGSLSPKWRMSVLNMQTRSSDEVGLPAQNFTVAALQRNFWSQSNIQLSFVNKQSLGFEAEDSVRYFNQNLWNEREENGKTIRSINKYNRVASADVELRSADNSWYSSWFYTYSIDDFYKDDVQAGGFFVQHTKRNYGFFFGENFVQKNYTAEAGFVPSRGVYPGVANTFLGSNLVFYPNNAIISMGPSIDVSLSRLPDKTITDRSLNASYEFNFRNTAELKFNYDYTFQRLTNAFKLVDRDDFLEFFQGERYDWHSGNVNFQSDQRKLLRYSVSTSWGGFYNGTNYNVNGELSYRYQPFGSLSVRFDYNDLRLAEGYGQEKIFIVSPRMDLTLTDQLFITTFVQYNNLADNVNLNARFQWRYKPASDFFVVYTENYVPGGFASKNRALVFKLTYWFNI